MNAIIEKGTMGTFEGEPIYSIIIDDDTETDVNFMSLVQFDGTLQDLSEEFNFSDELTNRLRQMKMYESAEIELSVSLDLVK